MSTKRSNKLQLALAGLPTTPKLFTALEVSYGLCGAWERVIVVGSSSRDGRYQHLGPYSTLGIARDASPQRYMELVTIAASCGKEVVILSSLSDEWQYGVACHENSSYHSDVLAAHRTMLGVIKHAPIHVIACFDTHTVFLQRDGAGKRRLRSEQLVQQPGVFNHFFTALQLDKCGRARVEKDGTKVFPDGESFKLSVHHGALLADWCRSGEPVISRALQARIDACTTLAALYQLLFDLDVDDPDVLTAFTKRRLELDDTFAGPPLEVVAGGLL